MGYNATVWRMDGDRVVSVSVAEVNAEGAMLRGNAAQCTGFEGRPAYDVWVRATVFAGHTLRIVKDDGAGYRGFLRGLRVPPARVS